MFLVRRLSARQVGQMPLSVRRGRCVIQQGGREAAAVNGNPLHPTVSNQCRQKLGLGQTEVTVEHAHRL